MDLQISLRYSDHRAATFRSLLVAATLFGCVGSEAVTAQTDEVDRPGEDAGPRSDATSDTVRLTFASDFSTAVGGSREALSDGGKWTTVTGRAFRFYEGVQGGQVVPASGLEFPQSMKNVYRGILYAAADPVVRHETPLDIDVPRIGEFFHTRIYFRLAIDQNVLVNRLHWFHIGGIISPIHINLHGHSRGPTVPLLWGGYGKFNHWVYGCSVALRATYRLAIGFERVAYDNARLRYLRLYDASNNLVCHESDLTVEHKQNGVDGTSVYDVPVPLGPDPSWGTPDEAFRKFQIGPNDSYVTGYTGPDNFLYFGGFAIRVSGSAADEIGPYDPQEVR